MVKMVKNYRFCQFFLLFNFLRSGTLQRARVFCVAFSATKPFFWAIKINNPTFFLIFHPKGGPFWFRGGNILPSPEIIGLDGKQKRFLNRKTMENKLGTCTSWYLTKNYLTIHLPLQAKQKSNHWCEIKPLQEKNLKYFFSSKVHYFFLIKATTKTKPVPERSLGEL